MKIKKRLQNVTKHKENCKEDKPERSDLVHNFVVLTACAAVAVTIAVVPKVAGKDGKNQVFAAAETESGWSSVAYDDLAVKENYLPTGIAGVVTGVAETPSVGSSVKRIGTSCERVMVGQRVKKVEGSAEDLNVSSSMKNSVNSFDAAAITMAKNPKLMSDSDYDTLLRIVEAEAGGEDIKGRVLVANVIMNRVESDEFPDTVTDVVWEYDCGVPQFSPTYDGRINEVTVSDETREAVKQALEGVDYSQGALFFVQKDAADKKNVAWFDKELKKLFKYGVHDFYTYPDENSKESSDAEKNTGIEADDNVVQMVKK
ncbi:cell wall hydrolase [Ruminococcus sp. 5_1_39BFAA]|uniref:cell wall hydrolase n=1 Tax=Ruminococcus sp. 5_1_39BFAA TaxID=457412 RepID=UPI0035673C56